MTLLFITIVKRQELLLARKEDEVVGGVLL